MNEQQAYAAWSKARQEYREEPWFGGACEVLSAATTLAGISGKYEEILEEAYSLIDEHKGLS